MVTVSKAHKQIDGASRIVRYADLRPCFDAFIDTRSPGSDKKENFTIIGPGVSENPNQYVHIAEPHGFNIGGARQPPGCVNSQHSHDTAEVFFVHSGTWSFNLGEHGDDANITLKPGDLISIPTKVFRGFENIGQDMGYLWAILGKDDPGRVLWAPRVFEMAKEYGLVLLENGSLIDTAKGEKIPVGAKPMPVTTLAQMQALKHFTNTDLQACCVMSDENVAENNQGALITSSLIGPAAKLSWPHGFTLHHMRLLPSGSSHSQISDKADVVFVHEGELSIKFGQDEWTLGPGDTATIPRGMSRQFVNRHESEVVFLRVQGDT